MSLQESVEEVWLQNAADRAGGDRAVIRLCPEKNTSGFRRLVQVSSQTAEGSEGKNIVPDSRLSFEGKWELD